VELADTLDLGSSARAWGFKSLQAHQIVKKESHHEWLSYCCKKVLTKTEKNTTIKVKEEREFK
jgi:hypothetical protein